MADFVSLGFELAFKYRNPAIILADGVIGQMMEKVVLPAQKPRRTDAEVIEQCPWATTGRTNGRKPNVITSLELKPEEMEKKEYFLIVKHHIDTNHHVNNGQYVQMAMELLPDDFRISQMRAEYKKAALLGDMVVPYIHIEEKKCTVLLCDEAQKPYAVVEFQ